jgi:hypothetical protein
MPVLASSGRIVGKPEVTRFHPSRGLLATNLPLFPRRLQLPIPLGLNLLLMPGEHGRPGRFSGGSKNPHKIGFSSS